MKKRMLNLGLMGGLLVTLASVGGCAPAGEGEGGFDWTIIIFLIVLFGLMYLVLIRPQRKRQKEHQQLVEELKRGDRVVTAGGIYGQVESISEDSVVIKVESGVTMRVAKGSVALKRER
ncbi:MAG: preprotein translocase subunit YajC [Dehalococcoidales bacterium]